MRHIAVVCCTILLSSAFVACEKDKEKDSLAHTPELVINAIFTPDSFFQVEVSRTRAITEPRGIAYVDDAIVEIYEGNQLLERLPYKQLSNAKGYYRGDGELAKAQSNYTVVVRADGYKTVRASNTIPSKVELIDTETKNSQVIDNSIRGDLVFDFQEPVDVENYYHLIIHRPIIRTNESTGQYEITGYSIENVHPVGIDVIEDFNKGFLFSDVQFNGVKKDIVCGFNTSYDASRAPLDHFVIELRSVSKDYYLYHKTLNEQHYNSNIKIVDVHSNVIDGYGIFAGYQTSMRVVEF